MTSVTVSGAPDGVTASGLMLGNSVVLSATAACRVTTSLDSRTYPLNITVTDANGATSSGTVNLVVTPNATPTLGTYANVGVDPGSSATVTPSAAPADSNGNLLASPLSLSPTTPLPSGVTLALNQSTGAAKFTVGASATPGTVNVRLQVQDTCGATKEQVFTLTVNSAPALTNASPSNAATAGKAYSYTFAASGNPAPSYSVSSGTLPPGLSLNAITGVLSGTPTTPGVYNGLQVTATNGAGTSTSATFYIRVVNTLANYTASYGLSGVNAAPGIDPDGDGLNNLLEYALNLNPAVNDAGNPALPASTVAVRVYNTGSYLSIRFTRAPLATDVTYLVEASADLVNWTTVATRAGGTVLTGPSVVSDSSIFNSPHTVEVRDTVVQDGSPAAQRRFLRLRVTQ